MKKGRIQMSTTYGEVPTMRGESTTLKKDIIWKIDNIEYKVINVPYSELDAEEDEYLNLDVSLKLTMIRDLMVSGEIPCEVDFGDVVDLEFKFS